MTGPQQTDADGPQDCPVTGSVVRVDLADAVYKLGFTRADAGAHVDAVLDLMLGDLAQGADIKLSGFGRLQVVTRSKRSGRDPRTGDTLLLPPRKTVVFRPAPALRTALTRALVTSELP